MGDLVGRGFRICDYAAVEALAPCLVLRHDVDFDLDAALAMAEVEHREGWRGIYFVLLRSEFYNPFSPHARAALTRLGELGHGIGLHFDAALYNPDPSELAAAAERECRILEDLSAHPVAVFSLHRPAAQLLDRDLEVPGRVNAYGARYFRDIGYCSDSRGAWHHGHPLDHPTIGQGRALQLLTHPIWWTAPEVAAAGDKVARALDRRAVLLDRQAAENCTAYAARIGRARQ